MTIPQLTELLGWVSIINIGYLLLATIIISLIPNTLTSLHSKILRVDKETLPTKYLNFLSLFKVMTLVFVISPYIALKIMGH